MTEVAHIILFDGHCNLCNGVVRFVINRDPDAKFRFAPLQSDTGRRLLDRHGMSTVDLGTFVLIQYGQVYVKSEAALRVARELSGVWRYTYIFRMIPRVLRDAIYDVVAKYRYRWFGRQDSCMLPTPAIQSRFLDEN